MKKLFIFVTLSILGLTSCSSKPEGQKKIKLIFETDMGNDVDDALALDMIYKYVEVGKVDLLAIMSNKNSAYSAEFTDIMATWYGHADVPIGIVKDGVDSESDAVNYARVVCEIAVDGKPAFERTRTDYESLPEAAGLYRKMLAQQPDHSVHLVSVGFSTNIAKLLDTPADAYSPLTGKELVAAKVKQLVMMAGSFGENPLKEYNVVKDIPAVQKIFSEWPTPVVITPFEVGIKINYPAASIENDFNWGVLHPMVEAYKAYLPMPYDRPTWDLTAVLYVAEPDSVFMNKSPQGIIHVDSAGYTIFEPVESGNHIYLDVTDEQADKIKNYFIRLITQKPRVL
ncbi:MAG: nucleoside hydrolase [Dysgonamonadaceae bacterium]|jgi:inosine-uridine nucleoside N-ribohydrolase|nr:nucleoside hydrolase [Dysgonamonadaceae bacterium]